jgi:hypothetical protein
MAEDVGSPAWDEGDALPRSRFKSQVQWRIATTNSVAMAAKAFFLIAVGVRAGEGDNTGVGGVVLERAYDATLITDSVRFLFSWNARLFSSLEMVGRHDGDDGRFMVAWGVATMILM